MENALQRLENVTLEESRMTGAEAFKAIHGVQGMMRGITDLLRDVDKRVREIGDKVKDSAQIGQLPTSTVLIARCLYC